MKIPDRNNNYKVHNAKLYYRGFSGIPFQMPLKYLISL